MKIQFAIRQFLLCVVALSISYIYGQTNAHSLNISPDQLAALSVPTLDTQTISKQPAQINPIITEQDIINQKIPEPTATESTPHAAPTTAQRIMIEQILNSFITPILKQLTAIDGQLEDLALLVGNNNCENHVKKNFLTAIRDMRDIIENIQKKSFLHVDLQTVYALLKINQALMTHLENELPNGFAGFHPFNIQSFQFRSMPVDFDFDAISIMITANEELFRHVSHASKNVGINKFNKAYRTFDRYLQQPINKYSLIKRTALVAGIAALAIWGCYRFSDSDILGLRKLLHLGYPTLSTADIQHKLDTLFGNFTNSVDIQNARVHILEEHANKVTLFGHVEERGYQIVTNPFTQLIAALTYFARPYYSAELEKMWNWITIKATKLHNKCMGGAYTTQKNNNSLENLLDPKTSFKDLVGMDHVKKELSVLVEYMRDPEPFDRAKRTPQKGFLLLGPPRTGKSFSAKALAGELYQILKEQNRPDGLVGFYEIPASLIIKDGISYWMNLAKAAAPCVLFIDEIDMLSLQRAGGSKEMLAEFLTAMSGTLDNAPNQQVIILAATNKPENLDEALRQRGRFGTEIRFEYPGIADREQFIIRKLTAIGVNVNNFDVHQLALETEDCSYEDLQYMITTAIDSAKSAGEILAQKHLVLSLNEIIRRIEMIFYKNMNDEELDILAVHQAGHALTIHLLSKTKKLGLVTIRPIKPKFKEESVWSQLDTTKTNKQPNFVYGDTFTYHLDDTLNNVNYQEAINDCKIELAGHVAERILLGDSSYIYHGEDREKAFDIASKLIARGVNMHHIPHEMECKNKYFNEAFALLDQYETEIHALLSQHQDTLRIIAQELKTRKCLTGQQIAHIVEHGSFETPATVKISAAT